MPWTVEPNSSHPKWPSHILALDEDEPLQPALLEYWKRILSDARSLAPPARARLAVEILGKTFEEDDSGEATATFYNSVNRQSDEIGVYVLRSDHFTCLQNQEEEDDEFEIRLLRWQL